MKLKAILEKKGFAVVMTREEDRGLYEDEYKEYEGTGSAKSHCNRFRNMIRYFR